VEAARGDVRRHHDVDLAALEVGDGALALRLLAETAFWQARDAECARLLEECLRLEPAFPGARFRLAVALYRTGRIADARASVEEILRDEPQDTSARFLKATILAQTGGDAQSAAIYADLVAEYPQSVSLWMSYGNVLKTSGDQEASLAAYRRIIELDPDSGMAWWSLSNFKTVRFTPEDLAAMRARVDLPTVSAEQRLHFHFALGKACEDLGDHAAAFLDYAEGNRLKHAGSGYDRELVSADVAEIRRGLGRALFESRRGWGLADRSPIFVVGLPRSGSTLIEQILSSHSQVEGTAELPYMPMMVREELGKAGSSGEGAGPPQDGGLSHRVAALGADRLRSLGERYLAAAAAHRTTDRPFFIDKALNNFFNVGVIHLILPEAKIIDTRRHPLSCGFSNFKQLFVRGQLFSYGLRDIGLYYRDYVRLMAHWDAVLPGVVHRVVYERMVQDTEGEVRRLLAHCGLPFEEGCLAFHRNKRAVRTVSSEQVRRPIYTEGMDHWRNYEPWLGEMKEALGSVLGMYPEVPPELR
ncbi:MAG: sulfotransferase family protein, partial [Gammaproteobacteria bacterium]|nr:sulfotransferase family protein [Gammaproteobacteria bacterium]